MSQAWDRHAEDWIRWAREPGHDSYWRFHRDEFLSLLPPPPARVLDLGCGEGRLPRDLKARGYEVVGVDFSSTLVEAARHADPGGDYRVADAAAVDLPGDSFDVVVAFMSLQDMDDTAGALAEAVRVAHPGGNVCIATVHPINSAGMFESSADGAPFQIAGSYHEPHDYVDEVEKDGLRMTFASRHRSLQAYTDLLRDAGLRIDLIREVYGPQPNWQRIPLFLDLRATPAG